MAHSFIRVLFTASILLLSNISLVSAQAPDGAVKITSRMVAPGIGLSWGDGVLTYKGRDYPFTFKATGLFRDVDPGITAAELAGEVFDLKSVDDLNGTYQKVDAQTSQSGGASRATIRNQKGVIVNLMSTVQGRKFDLAREGMEIELKK